MITTGSDGPSAMSTASTTVASSRPPGTRRRSISSPDSTVSSANRPQSPTWSVPGTSW